ncbi:tetratricopeptide repeat protein [Seleniivibrio woodruffii]|uniref:Tetratricopeptide repeat protein n=1 Tax=Seleniivibrio woodruffii TaxID=1078050 RepID=A0A4R1KCB4_9BACT|nr:tetratricopeptide repeat protein [Seleniivibrio woodruffii]TCK60789.1 hypothetical protein C8D98_1668 [Seleniivibrio woodruffii]TVZ36419.1 hypothetical protein OF66_2044 [Seleniivibrio woodruffii]
MLFKPKEPDIFEAHSLYVDGKYDKALQEYEMYYAQNADSTSALRMMANIHLMAEDRAKAESLLIRLADKYIDSGQYYSALNVISRMLLFSADKQKLYRQAAETYTKLNRPKLATRYIFALADMFKSAGKFSECSAILMEIAKANPKDEKILTKILRKLTVLGMHREISEILTMSAENGALPDYEIDDVTVYLLESNCPADLVMPFVKGLLRRNPHSFEVAEHTLISHLSRNFDPQEFVETVALAPSQETRKLTLALREVIADKAILSHLLFIEAETGDRDRIKGVIYEMFLENAIDMDAIADICRRAGNDIALEEASKMIASTDVKQTAPEKTEEPVHETVDYSSVPFELETFDKSEDIASFEPVALDLFETDDSAPKVAVSLDIADDFGFSDSQSASADTPGGFEAFGFETPEQPQEAGFSGFEDENSGNITIKDDDFFSTPEKEAEKPHEVETIKFDENELKEASEKEEKGKKDFFSLEMEG